MADIAALDWGVWAVAVLAVFAGTMLQRLAGQGFGMLATPMIALVAPEYLPASILLMGLVVGLASATIELSAVTRAELPPGFAGRTLGAVVAAWIAASLVDTGVFALLVAGVVYLGIALSLIGVRVAIRPVSLFSAGVVAGIMGTLTAVGAPPMALLYQHEEARRSAVMQNTFFAFGMIVSIAALGVAGLIGLRHLLFAAILIPVVLVALAVAQPAAKRVAKAQIRPYALGLAGLAATVLLLKQVV